MISSSPFESFRRFETERGLPQDFLRGVNATNHHDNAWAKFERADIDLQGFDQAFADECAALGHVVRGREVIELLGGTIRPSMVEALRRLKPKLKIGLITNNVASPDSVGLNPSGRDEVMAMFHQVIDPLIYRMMCDALGVAPERSVFLDDLGVNLKPARDMGMRTIKVGDPDLALQQLEALVGFPLRG